MQLLPGKSIFSPPKPKMPPPPPAPTVVERDSPDVTAARDELRKAELRRKGRVATILTGNADLDDEASLGRPAAGGTTSNTNLG